jgi:hypothetical protein
MSIRLGSAVRSGLVVASATAVTFAAVAAPAPEVRAEHASVPTAICVELTAASQPQPPTPALAQLSPAQVLEAARVVQAGQALSAAAPNLATTPGLTNLADFIDNAYVEIEKWVRYAFEWVAYAAGWIPYIGWIINDQIWVVYNFVESLIHSGVFNVTDWMRGEGTFAKNLADWVVDLGLAVAWLAIDEIGAWIPLPPFNYPPRPPWADLPEGLFGDVIVDASAALARVSNGIWNVWEPIRDGIDGGVAWISGVLDRFARVPFVPLINFELNEAWTLVATGGDQLTGFAHDMINAGNQFIVDTVQGGGLIAATVTAFNTTVASIRARGGASIQAFVDWGRAQIDYLVDRVTPGTARVVTPGVRVAEVQAAEEVSDPVAVAKVEQEPEVAPKKVRSARTAKVAKDLEAAGPEPSSGEPAVDEPAVDEVEEPEADEPDTELDTDKPDADADKPSVDKPSADKPDADKPAADAKPSASPAE